MLQKESDFLDECNDYCHTHVISKLRLAATAREVENIDTSLTNDIPWAEHEKPSIKAKTGPSSGPSEQEVKTLHNIPKD